jgi:L-amino acid N-acyltransferase YncA
MQLEWLEKCLGSGTCMIWIGEVDGCPVGKVRANFLDGLCELSWTVAPGSRGHGYGKQLLRSAIELISYSHFLARIKDFNLASQGIAKSLGFQLVKEEAGVGFWELHRS